MYYSVSLLEGDNVVNLKVPTDPQIIHNLLLLALRSGISVNVDEFIYEKKAELLSKVDRENLRVEIIEDMTVPERQCIIETENGVFDCGIDTQLAELKNRFKLLSFQK